jgi:phage shock protein PspC (stress-responsive transcriptional regulator)
VNTTRRLYRSRHDRVLGGIAGGMAEYLEIDPTLVRVLWILSAFLGGFTILAYIILLFIIPLAPYGGPAGSWTPSGTWAPGTWAPGGPAGAWTPGPTWAPGPAPTPSSGWATAPGQAATGRASGPAQAAASDPTAAGSVTGDATADAETTTIGATDAAADGGVAGDADPVPGLAASGETPAAGWDATTGWSAPPAWNPNAGWSATPAWSSPVPPDASVHRGPGAAAYLGIVLVIVGAFALADAVIPGLAAVNLGPVLLVAIGAALLVASLRRRADQP